MEKLATLLTTSRSISPDRNASYSRSRCRDRRLAGDHAVRPAGRPGPRAGRRTDRSPGSAPPGAWRPGSITTWLLDCERWTASRYFTSGFGDRVRHPFVLGERDPDLDAVGGGDVALRFDVLPGSVGPLRTDQARTRSPRGRPRGPGWRSNRAGDGPAGRRSSGTPGRAAGAPRRTSPGPSRGHRTAPDGGWKRRGAWVVITWYVAMVTGRNSLLSPRSTRRSPPPSGWSGAAARRFHCRAATVFVTRISVVALRLAPSRRRRRASCPAPQGSTTTPDPPCQNAVDGLRAGRRAATSRSGRRRSIGVRLAVDVARQVLGGPADLEQGLLEVAALGRVHHDGVVVDRGHRAAARSAWLLAAPPRAPGGRC